MSHPVEWFGLETNAPIIETIPLFRGTEPEFEIKRIMPRKPRKSQRKRIPTLTTLQTQAK